LTPIGLDDSARNLVSSLIKNLSVAQHSSSTSKSCFLNIRDLRRIRNTIDQTTACTNADSLIHSKIDFSNALLLNLPAMQTNRLQFVQNVMQRVPVLSYQQPSFETLE